MRKGSYRNERFSPFYRILSQQKQGAKMKRSVILFVAALFLILQGSVMAQDMLVRRDDGQSSLPQLQSGLPDPAAVLGSVGSLYQQGYQYYDKLYDAYLYPRPEAAEDFINTYTSTAGNAGFIASADVIDGYNALRIRPIGNDSLAALLFYDYQGYMMFMVPDGMTLTMNIEPDENADAAQLVQLGNSAIQSQDYQRAIRYLIRAAEQYLRIPETPAADAAPTALPSGPSTYVVQEGDNCWSIAVDKFGVNFELFMQVNGMTSCDIGIGDEVIIPGSDQQLATPTPIPLDQYTTGQIVSYTVQMNDSYNDIASMFNTTLDSIQRLNNVNAYTGFPQYGQVLQIEVNLVTPTPTPEVTATPEPGTLEP